MATSKQQYNRKKFTKEFRVKEIQKNITKRTRLKKNYFKALKEEGYSAPERPQNDKDNNDRKHKKVRELKEEKRQAGKEKFDEKKQLKKDRMQRQREEKEAHRQSQLQRIETSKAKHLQREQRTKRLTQKTRSGQPLMGPKILDMLEKIKNDDTYTN